MGITAQSTAVSAQ